MSDPGNITDPTPNVDPSTNQEPAGGDTTGDNPAWDPIRTALDETTYALVKPHLVKFDQDAQQRIQSSNERYAWAGKLIDGGMTSQEVEQAAALAQELRDNPLGIFENLNGYVKQYYPSEYAQLAWIAQQAAAASDPSAEQPNGEDGDDPRYNELKQRQDQLDQQAQQQQQFFEEMETRRMYDEASAQIDAEFRDISGKRPDLQKEDWREIMGYAASKSMEGQKPVTVTEAVAWYDSITNRIRTAPRPGDSAPSLLPLGGGNPGSPQKVDYADMSDDDIVAAIAADVDAKNKQR